MREWKGEGRMSPLQLRTRSGKVVLERAEGVRIPSQEIVSTGRILSPFFTAHDRFRTSFAIAFACVFGNGKRVFLVLARIRFLVKPPFQPAFCLCDHIAPSKISIPTCRVTAVSLRLEWDRGIMDVRDVAVKFDTYRLYVSSGV